MTPNRPYLVRALWDWIADNNMTPHLMVDAMQDGVEVPVDFVEDGRIVLNISSSAVQNLDLGNEHISFHARFGGASMRLLIPLAAVLGIYARENGQGMLFSEADDVPLPPEPAPEKPKRPALKVVK